ncbi:MAG: ATP-binding protein [Candidatus Omnitrophota bacterium]
MPEDLSKLIDNAPVIVLCLDTNQNILLCNKKIQNLTGLKSSEILGKNWLEILFRDPHNGMKREMFKAVMDDSTTYKRQKDFQCHIYNDNQKKRLISWSINPILDNQDNIEAITLFGQDITEIAEMEVSIKNIDDSLKHIFASIKEYALYVINLDGNITYFGMGSSTLLGWEKKDIIFKHVSTLHSDEENKLILDSILKQTHLLGKYETETELITKDRKAIPVILTVNQFLDPAGKLSGFIFIAKDMTERKKLEYQIFQAEKLAALGQLSAGMAHEINNPLFVISGRLEMLKQEKLDQKIKDTLALIDTQTDRIRNLVDRILKYARKTNTSFELVNVNEAIESVLPWVYYNKLPSAEVAMEKTFENNLPKVKGDLHQLQEVFLNILINAYQSMPKGGRIKVSTKKLDDGHIQIKFTDSGVGIPAQQLKNIFMPFYTTKNEGLGLGLSICHNIIKGHGGTIDLTSEINQGSTFTIKLPFA